jgi:predicted ribonuclease YlaK
VHLQDGTPVLKTILLTNDTNVRLKAFALGIPACKANPFMSWLHKPDARPLG